MQETKLVENCQKWNLQDFWPLYDKYVDKIYKFIYIKTSKKEVSEDLTSEVFIKVLNNIERFKIKSWATFRSWIYRIAQNLVIDYYRCNKEEQPIEDYMNLWKIENIWKTIDDKQKLKKVFEFLDTLKKEHKEIVIMRIWDELSYKEIAEVMNMTEVNCKQIFCRTIKKIDPNIILLVLLLIKI